MRYPWWLSIILLGCAPDGAVLSTSALGDGECLPTDEVCNGLDDDCDFMTDEGVSTTWFSDCDGDGYASYYGATYMGCAEPSPEMTGCGTATQQWTTTEPNVRGDCIDEDARCYDGARPWQSVAISSDYAWPETDYDFDCDGVETPRWATYGSCWRVGRRCARTRGWVDEIPECGEQGAFLQRCARSGESCVEVVKVRTQSCR